MAVVWCQFLAAGLRLGSLCGVSGGMFDVVEAGVSDVRVCAGACPVVVVVAPVAQVVQALPAGFGPVGHFVPVEACCGQRLVDHGVAVGVGVFVRLRDDPFAYFAGHGGAVFDDERVGADVVDRGVENRVERGAQVVIAFAGGAVDDVKVEVFEACGVCFRNGLECTPRGVAPLEDA